jgi:hypothetical protein
VRLHEVLRGTGHTLLVVDPASGPAFPPRLDSYAAALRPVLIVAEEVEPVAADCAIDVAGDVRGRYGRGVFLIRPDGYLAASGLDAVEEYLRRLLSAGPYGQRSEKVCAGYGSDSRMAGTGQSRKGAKRGWDREMDPLP